MSRKGHKHSDEAKRKIGLTSKGRVPWNKGLTHETDERLKLMSYKYMGRTPWNKGETGIYSKETIKKMSESHKAEKCYNWKGRVNEKYPMEWTSILRESIRTRDDYVCQECGIHQEELQGRFKNLDIHHIDYNKDNLDPSNLISLCRSCHIRTNHHREYWIEHFADC
jgi:hypothetical protein